jgi:hypothetical protein
MDCETDYRGSCLGDRKIARVCAEEEYEFYGREAATLDRATGNQDCTIEGPEKCNRDFGLIKSKPSHPRFVWIAGGDVLNARRP